MGHSNSRYIHTFKACDNNTYGFRYAKSSDIDQIIEIFKETYDWNYLHSWVYDKDMFHDYLKKSNYFWMLIELIEQNEICAIGLMEIKNKISLYASKVAAKKKYRGLGLLRVLGTQAVMHFFQRDDCGDIIRLDTDVRANILNSQIFAEKIRCIPYGFIPNFNNYADKRNFNPSKGEPFTAGRIESVMMYVNPLSILWKNRSRDVHIYEDEEIMYFYNYVKSLNRKMKRDNLELINAKSFEKRPNEYTIREDIYQGIVFIEGYLRKSFLNRLLVHYQNWNVIVWNIPTTSWGLYSQLLALKNEFIVSGYNPGSYTKELNLRDTILMCKFPRGIDYSQFKTIDLAEKNKPIAKRIIKMIKEVNIKNMGLKEIGSKLKKEEIEEF